MRRLILAAAACALLLSGCGSSEEPGAAPSTSPSGSTAAGPVTVTDFRNKEIKLPGPATKVVGLEWGVVENLVTLGVMPVGVADVKGYSTWVTAAKLDPSVKDVGTRGEVSVDSVVALEPDLVIAVRETPQVIAQLEKYVPVLVVRGADASNAIPQMRKNLEIVGAAVGKSDDATRVLADFDKALADGKQKIAAAGKAGQPFTMADGYKQGSTVSIRMYAAGSLLGAVGTELGLKNGWTGDPGDKDYGLAQTDVEGLTKLGDVHFLYIASDKDGGDVFGGDLAKNAIWKNLPFVKSGKVYRLPDGIWMFGGPLSTQQFIEATVKALTS
jgi:ferric hydroxamate transport system substrate-binding protein